MRCKYMYAAGDYDEESVYIINEYLHCDNHVPSYPRI